jgi:hypothetical protein
MNTPDKIKVLSFQKINVLSFDESIKQLREVDSGTALVHLLLPLLDSAVAHNCDGYRQAAFLGIVAAYVRGDRHQVIRTLRATFPLDSQRRTD